MHQIFKVGDESNIYIGRGIEKVHIKNPEKGFENFLSKLTGGNHVDYLRESFEKCDDWLKWLESFGIIDYDGLSNEVVNPEFDLYKYSRQIFHFALYDNTLEEAIEFQRVLLRSKVVILGVGAGGTTLARFLATAGFGNLDIIDFDCIDESNITTHVAVDQNTVGMRKIDVTKEIIKSKNNQTNVKIYEKKIGSSNQLMEYIKDVDLVIQAFDKPVGISKKWVNEACVALKKPYLSIGQTDKNGRVTLCVPGVTPCAECIGLPEIKIIRQHAAAPLTAALVSILGGIAVHELTKYVTKCSDSILLTHSILVDSDDCKTRHIKHKFNPECQLCSHLQRI